MNPYIHRDALPKNYCILWYEIQSVLGQGGFGVTYLAWDKNLEQTVAIKEYLPSDLSIRDGTGTVRPKTREEGEAYRWGLAQFLSEARTLSRFQHPNIVRVRTSFEQNNTAYMVMDYESGHDLERHFKSGHYTDEAALLRIFLPILDGLSLIHKAGFIHRDIKPANIYVRQDGAAVLLDFGSARQAVAERTHIITSLVSPGYAPFEQYDVQSKKQGPWTDIYAIGATLYHAISGTPPPEAVARSNAKILNEPDPYVSALTKGAGRYSRQFLSTVDYALRLLPADRPGSVEVLLEALTSKGGSPSEQQPSPSRPSISRSQSPQLAPIHELLAHAEEHFRAGHLVDPPGHNALERYRQVLALEPQNDEAVRGLTKLRNHYLRLAEQAIGNEQPELARKHLQIADHIRPGTQTLRQMLDHVARAEKRVSRRKRRNLTAVAFALAAIMSIVGIGSVVFIEWSKKRDEQRIRAEKAQELLVQAAADFESGRLIEPPGQNALERYRLVLSLDKDSAKAKQGIEEILAHYATLAERAIASEKIAVARDYLEIVDRIRQGAPIPVLPKTPIFPDKKVASSKGEKLRNEIAALVAEADADFRAGRFTAPKGDNALENYRRALRLDPSNSAATHGISRLVHHYVKAAEQAIATGQLDIAAQKLNVADNIEPSSSLVKKAWTRLKTAQNKRKPGPVKPSPNRMEDLLAEAKAHIEAQRLIEPPTENALETYQSILALDPDNADAKQGISEIQEYYIAEAEKAWKQNMFETAREYLRIAETVDPGTDKIERAWSKLMSSPGKNDTPSGSAGLF